MPHHAARIKVNVSKIYVPCQLHEGTLLQVDKSTPDTRHGSALAWQYVIVAPMQNLIASSHPIPNVNEIRRKEVLKFKFAS